MARKIEDEQVPALAQRIESVELSDGAKLAIVLCAGAFRFGGNWGYINKDKDLAANIEVLREERKGVKIYQVSNGALVVSDENFLAHNINKIIPNAINGSFVEMSKKRRQDEATAFTKFLTNVSEGKSKYVKGQSGRFDVTLGIYSVNETKEIRIAGKEYPAYKLSLNEVLHSLDKLTKQGRKVLVRAKKEDGTEVYDTPFNLGSNSKGIQAVFRGLEIANSNTGVFLQISIQ